MLKPNYDDGSIVNLMASLALGLGERDRGYGPLALLSPELVRGAHNVVLMLLDGLGYNYLRQHPSAFDRHLRGSMTSVFPSSTAPAITTLGTGVAPQQHGITGWFMNLKEFGAVTMILPFCARGGMFLGSTGVRAGDLMGAGPLFDDFGVRSYLVSDMRLVDTPYTVATAGGAERIGYRDLEDCFARINGVIAGGGERKFIYAYWPRFDALAHQYGVASSTVQTHFEALARGFEALTEALRGTETLLIVTADHGFIDTGSAFTIRLEAHALLARCLSVPLCGEPRVAFCYVRAGAAVDFEQYVSEHLGEGFACFASEEFIRAGWLGLGSPEPRLLQRLGDYVLLAKDRFVIKDTLPMEHAWADTGVHGGASEDEMLVPLIVASC